MREFTVLDLLDLDLREHNHLQLKCIAGRSGLSRTIKNSKISRPGLALTGYFEDFSGSSIQLIGRAEQSYIEMLEKKNEYENIERIFSYEPPCIVFIGGYKPSEHFVELVLNDTGFDPDGALLDIEIADTFEVTGHVDDDTRAQGLTVGAGTTAARGKDQRGQLFLLCELKDTRYVLLALREEHGLRHFLVDGVIGSAK